MSGATAVPELDLGGHQGTEGFRDEPLLNLPDEPGLYLPTGHKQVYRPTWFERAHF